mgnify:CR=1 FL=1
MSKINEVFTCFLTQFFVDIIRLNGEQVDFEYTDKKIQPQVFNYGFGLSYSFGQKPNNSSSRAQDHNASRSNTTSSRAQDHNASRSNTTSSRAQDHNASRSNTTSSRAQDHNASRSNTTSSRAQDHNASRSNTTSSKNSGSIVLTNLAKEKADRKDQQQKIISVLPKNNSVFKNSDELKKFTWKIIGTKIANPQFIIEVTKIGNNQQAQRTYIGKTTKTNINPSSVFKESKPSDGQYRWKVTETTTGNSSDVKFFTFSNCEIDFAISNEEIECLGYEGENRKFKICFDSTYSSTSGDLTFANPGSGLSVFDQTYAALTYTMVSPNPTLLTQIGATSTTVSYCFEVTVSASVTAIGFGLQGDDLDPSPVLCQPGVSANFDELPECICDECEEIEVSFDNFNISLNGTTGNQFNFDGDINVNVPIYGIEFQIQSYSYSANPSACSEGVSNVEESGMILMPGTSINGSTSLQLVNETASGSTSSNNNATKNIKYISNSALNGAIPVNLTIGLPGPISGLDPSCCAIDYTVCIKVKVFYEESNCKSCVFTHCFNFNNQ